MNKSILNLPHTPGVYLMRAYSGEILYIGKANDLLKRVSSYFSKKQQDPRIASMLSSVSIVDYIILKSEKDALLTEDRLIKRFLPKYNVALRDDKSYPYIKVTTDEKFPRICLVRHKNPVFRRKGPLFFGPYHNAGEVKRLLRWLRASFKICPCGRDAEKMKGCLYRHIEFCPAPCEGKISRKYYIKNIVKVIMFLKGDYASLKKQIELEMSESSKRMDFERAAELRDNILAIDGMFQRVGFREINETELAGRIETSRALSMLKEYLNLPVVPLTIEAFDISNISGTNPAGSMVVFTNGTPDKRNYRMYKIKAMPKKAVDDYLMMQEVVSRRYKRLLFEQKKLPDLILVDGGKGHLSAAAKALSALGLDKIPVAAIAKREEEIFVPGKAEPKKLTQDNPALLLLRHIRDEAHRFAVRFHRHRRGNLLAALLAIIMLFLAAVSGQARAGRIIFANGNCLFGDISLSKDGTISLGLKNGSMKINRYEIKKIIYDVTRNEKRDMKWSETNCNYDDVIIKCAYENNISPALVKAVMHAESDFYARSISSKGAKGLMQLSQENLSNFCIEDPFNPWHNVSAGTRYLKLQLDRYRGDMDKALAAYNAGPGAVKKYNGVPPYQETRNFIATVKKLYAKYSKLWKMKGRSHSYSDEKGKLYFYNE